MSEDTRAEALEQPEYCNVCENFPCLGNHPSGEAEPDVIAEALERYERAVALIRQGWVTRDEAEREFFVGGIRPIYFSPFRNSLVIREGFAIEKRVAEDRDRREWIDGIRRRLGLVTEVHRTHVHREKVSGAWSWTCRRCVEGTICAYDSQAQAFTYALAHARSFVPQPPEAEPWTELDVLAFEAIGARILPAGRWMPWLDLTGLGPARQPVALG